MNNPYLRGSIFIFSTCAFVASNSVMASWGFSASYGNSDYEYNVEVLDPDLAEAYSYDVGTDFGYVDLTLDYSWGDGKHQIGVKHAALLEETGLNPQEGFTDMSYTGISGLGYNYSSSADGERDETSLFYSYRFGGGWAWTTGYYSGSFENANTQTYSWNQTGLDLGLTESSFPTSDTIVEENEVTGYFTGLGYGMSFGGGWGGFARLGYQWSEVENLYDASAVFSDGFEYRDQIYVNSDGSATVFGVGVFYALSEDWVVTLQYDSKSYSYDASQPVVISDGEVQNTNGFGTSIDESQDTIYLTLRWVP